MTTGTVKVRYARKCGKPVVLLPRLQADVPDKCLDCRVSPANRNCQLCDELYDVCPNGGRR